MAMLADTKTITVFGNRPASEGQRVMVSIKRGGPSYSHVLGEVNKLLSVPGGVKKLYSLPDCKLVKNLEQLGSMKTTNFVAVGKVSLDKSKLPRPVERADLTQQKALPGIKATPAGGGNEAEVAGIQSKKPLPGIDGDELDSSSHLKGFQTQDTAASHEGLADKLIEAAGTSDKHHSSERDRQRQAHKERMATRHKVREENRTRTIEHYAEGAEAKDRLVEEERTRQRALFESRIAEHKKRANTQRSVGATSVDESKAATKIQAQFRGHLARKEVASLKASRKSKGKSAPKKKKKKKKKTSKKDGGKSPRHDGADSPPSKSDIGTKSETSGDKSNISDYTTRDLLNADRIPTPDLHISANEMEAVRVMAATKIQSTYRGHKARAQDPTAQKVVAARAQRAPAKPRASEARAPAKKKKAGKKESAGGDTGMSSPPPAGHTQPTKLEREPSRFGLQIEARAKIEADYDIGDRIGDGNFAVVKTCIRKRDQMKFALKIIDKAKTRGAKETNMIENEIHTMRSVQHPHCVGLYDARETEDELFLVMDLVPGGDLFDRIVEKGKYPESDAVRLVRNMATAIHHLHSKNIIHRDLKPENLLVTSDSMGRDTIKLADFGLSMVVTEPLRTICGTPTYVAPEIIADTPEGYGLQVDLWATGVIAYIMLCGFPPFASASKNQKDLFRKIKSGKFSFPSPYWDGISENAKDLIRNLLKVNPAERYNADQLLAHPWIAEVAEDAVEFDGGPR